MVLFKRKPVQFLPPAEIEDDNAEVWLIKETGEVFVSYEDYLNRMDFYKQRRFNDQITGQSGMTFSKPRRASSMVVAKSRKHSRKHLRVQFCVKCNSRLCRA
uniref:WAC domain-containing protein n=1 Tax=Bionectria ochroleuca TaxID=29856 RepID=A0A8H7N5L3_BIOOC